VRQGDLASCLALAGEADVDARGAVLAIEAGGAALRPVAPRTASCDVSPARVSWLLIVLGMML